MQDRHVHLQDLEHPPSQPRNKDPDRHHVEQQGLALENSHPQMSRRVEDACTRMASTNNSTAAGELMRLLLVFDVPLSNTMIHDVNSRALWARSLDSICVMTDGVAALAEHVSLS
jgi:hypothetical protein